MKITRLSLAIVIILVLAILGIVTVNASAGREKKVDLAEENAIREVVQNYFNQRYSSRAVNQIKDFRGLTDGSAQAESFLKSETDKLEIEIHNAKLHYLGYTQYRFTLNFNDIWIDRDNQTATVSVTEGHDVVFEISEMVSKNEPIVSKMRNLEHTILLKNTQNGWKIVTDDYEDYLWRMLRATNLSKDELSRSIDEAQDQVSTIAGVESVTSTCNLPADESTHPYNRSGAVAYAHQYAYDPNPAYYYFPDNDCTNFVNQAIHHGSNAEEVGSNTFGWYYNYYNNYLDNDYSASWTDVGKLYEFISQYYVWDKGPEGCETDQYNALPGDLVQFEWQDDPGPAWDHSVIIVLRGSGEYGYLYWVAGHSDDIDDYPLDSIIYQSRRFVSIDRIDGYFKVYIPVAIKDSSGYLQDVETNPYPAPMESGGYDQPQAYPAPYPAP
ncbi:MAG: hypothetical protein B6D39_06155 [Anaerolineae bacterium UTCFX2]|nr:amidase domain-containing protein [Anaerolineae bacterium]MCZ7553730.1 amidase domain-containing protein [Anaerolineales bacterium]OQY91692.1 MAG: hypothetical protein B6D39_06155 [Anaerolineae bacterium UTCFX2]